MNSMSTESLCTYPGHAVYEQLTWRFRRAAVDIVSHDDGEYEGQTHPLD